MSRTQTLGTRGFSLMEVLVAMTIVALLLAVILTSISQARANARDKERITEIKQIELALALHFEATGAYPGETGDQLPDAIGLDPVYLPAVPQDPNPQQSGTAGQYRYGNVTATSDYVIIVSSFESFGAIAHCYITTDTVDPTSDFPAWVTNTYGTPGTDTDFIDCNAI